MVKDRTCTSFGRICSPTKTDHLVHVSKDELVTLTGFVSLRRRLLSKGWTCNAIVILTVLGLVSIGAVHSVESSSRIFKPMGTIRSFLYHRRHEDVNSLAAVVPQVLVPAPIPACAPAPQFSVPRCTDTSEGNPDIDVCILMTIGDNGDQPNDRALPYPLVSRLLNVMEAEMGAPNHSNVRILVGADYASIVCKMARDLVSDTSTGKVEWVSPPNIEWACYDEAMARLRFKAADLPLSCGKLVVGNTRRYVKQLPAYWEGILKWRSLHLVDLDSPDPGFLPPSIPEKNWRPTVITGFSSNHLSVGLLLLRSVGKSVKVGRKNRTYNVSVVVWAMEDFIPEHRQHLDCVIDELNNVYGVAVEVRQFNFSAYPSWMRINQDLGSFGGTGEYAWKAIMIKEVLVERGLILWADAGDRFHEPESLYETIDSLRSKGFVSRNSKGDVREWTHPLQLKYLRANTVPILEAQNCDASIIGFTLRKYLEFARPWYECSLTRQCIAPDGSDRANHRQDQAALSVLSLLTNNSCTGVPNIVGHHRDGAINDLSGAFQTKCYADPLQALLT